ncbi:hypothetical protein L6452_09042 [Arctium lappa]|uniref:Uncharacterized protein n=1 Tax=Arctium lappa TaxID=4217 RepID=A0ACB9DJI9_ARCLA|nr:hypothetical protein L6452_09042 [Arctium lappa]
MVANETKDDLYALALHVSYGDKPSFRFSKWLESVRERSSKSKASGFPHRPQRLDSMLLSAGDTSLESNDSPPEQVTEISLWERLGKVAVLNVESSSFSWDMLSSLHHTEHSCNNDSEDDMNKALEARVIHNCNSEWLKIKEAAEKARGDRC